MPGGGKHEAFVSTSAAFLVSSALGPNDGARAADQIFACVNNSSGEIKLVAQSATCKNNETLVVWNVVGPQGPIGPVGPQGPAGPIGPAGPGILAGSSFFCPAQVVPTEGFLSFTSTDPVLGTENVVFGTGISTSGSLFNSFVLQPGIYQVSLSADPPPGGVQHISTHSIHLVLNGTRIQSWRFYEHGPAEVGIGMAGDALVRVSSPNSVVQFLDGNVFLPGTQIDFCRLTILRLQ